MLIAALDYPFVYLSCGNCLLYWMVAEVAGRVGLSDFRIKIGFWAEKVVVANLKQESF